MNREQDTGFIPIEDILSPPCTPLLNPRTDRIARLEHEIEVLNKCIRMHHDTSERRLALLRNEQLLNSDLITEVSNHKASIERLESRYRDAQERISAQDSELHDCRAEINHLQTLIDQLEPELVKLRAFDLELKTHRPATKVLYQLLQAFDAHTSMDDIFRLCKNQVIRVDTSNCIHHPETAAKEALIDDMASVAPSDEASDAEETGDFGEDDEGHVVEKDNDEDPFDHLADDVDATGNIAGLINDEPDDQSLPLRQSKRKRTKVDKFVLPYTPTRARLSDPSRRGRLSSPVKKISQPLTPPSSLRKRLPRKAKMTPEGDGFYNLRPLACTE